MDAMSDVVNRHCEFAGCTKTPSYGYVGERAQFCSHHHLPDMEDVKNRRCEWHECRRYPIFGHEGERARFCSAHKTDDMVNVRNRRCEEGSCTKLPTHGFPGEKAKACQAHAKHGMVNLKGRKSTPHPPKREGDVNIRLGVAVDPAVLVGLPGSAGGAGGPNGGGGGPNRAGRSPGPEFDAGGAGIGSNGGVNGPGPDGDRYWAGAAVGQQPHRGSGGGVGRGGGGRGGNEADDMYGGGPPGAAPIMGWGPEGGCAFISWLVVFPAASVSVIHNTWRLCFLCALVGHRETCPLQMRRPPCFVGRSGLERHCCVGSRQVDEKKSRCTTFLLAHARAKPPQGFGAWFVCVPSQRRRVGSNQPSDCCVSLARYLTCTGMT